MGENGRFQPQHKKKNAAVDRRENHSGVLFLATSRENDTLYF